NHFPAIITEDAFFRVQSKINDNRGKRLTGNNDSKVVNLFSGVGYCSCGQKIKVTKSKNGYYMTCYGHVLGLGCNEPMAKYNLLENSFSKLLKMDPSQLVKDENGNTPNVNLQVLNGRLVEIQKQIDNITTFVLKGLATASLVET